MQTLKQLQDGELKGTASLKLTEQLYSFPSEIFDLADTLEILDLSFNNLIALPSDFGRLRKLKILFCSENKFRVLPEVLADCPLLDIVGFKSNQIETVPATSLNPNLRWLILTNNRITELPSTIGHCSKMQKLMLTGNKLTALPETLKHCTSLSLLRISANNLTELPNWMLNMPALSWLAFSGNSHLNKQVSQPISAVEWNSLTINRTLGEGASGIISEAKWKDNEQERNVAVKVFKGSVTSDGLPDHEMEASIGAGLHPGLIKLIGQVTGHPENKKALVMELIPPNFYNLGSPPSFESCTRDVFKKDQQIKLEHTLKIAVTIASIMEQLHSRGIMHGDLYAHNILTDEHGDTLFGDFGAAWFYDKGQIRTASALEGIEVSAYGYLLEDLIALSSECKENNTLSKLNKIRLQCADTSVSLRPGFKKLNEELSKLYTSFTATDGFL